MRNLAQSNKNVEYFVNWEKVYKNHRQVAISLNTANYLLGKKNIRFEAERLFTEQPDLLKIVPFLIATRDKSFTILEDVSIKMGEKLNYLYLDFKNIDVSKIDEYIEFMEHIGLLELLSEGGIKNLEDYVLGVEVGLDSNGRKNRSGTITENIIERTLENTLDRNRFDYYRQFNAAKIKKATGIVIPVKKSKRTFDFVIYNKQEHQVTLIEVNFYNGGGSKLKSVAGEFTTQHNILKEEDIDNVSFVWITDGPGWIESHKPLEDAYAEVDHIINFKMVSLGYLHDIINQKGGEQF